MRTPLRGDGPQSGIAGHRVLKYLAEWLHAIPCTQFPAKEKDCWVDVVRPI